jgi:hypothetical protein
MPAQAGIQSFIIGIARYAPAFRLDPGLRRGDGGVGCA